MIDCEMEYGFLESGKEYFLQWEEGENWVTSIDGFTKEPEETKGSRYTGDCFRPKSPMQVSFFFTLSSYLQGKRL